MKHKLTGTGIKTGPKILKDRVMSVVTRMRNTNFTIIRESPNNNDQVSPDDGEMILRIPASATYDNLSSENTRKLKSP